MSFNQMEKKTMVNMLKKKERTIILMMQESYFKEKKIKILSINKNTYRENKYICLMRSKMKTNT